MNNISKISSGSSSNRVMLNAMLLLFAVGELTGTVLFCTARISGLFELNGFLEKYFYNRLECTFVQAVINSFSGTFILIILCCLLGTGAFFKCIEYSIPLFQGMGTGILLAELNYSYGIKGLLFSLILIIPYHTISALTVAVAAREAAFMSGMISALMLKNSYTDKINFNLYLHKYIILTFIVLSASIIECMNMGLWMKIFGE